MIGTVQEEQKNPKPYPKYVIRDVLVLTRDMPKTNIFKQIYNAFNPVYNQITEPKRRNKVA